MRRAYNRNYKYLIFNNYNSNVDKLFNKCNVNSIYVSEHITVFHVSNELISVIISSIKIDVSQILMDDYYLLYTYNNKLDYQSFLNEFFTYISNDYDSIIDSGRNIKNIRNLETLLIRNLSNTDSLKILDFGCGTGLSLRALSKNHEIVGVDSCEMMLIKARTRGLNAFNINELDSLYNSEYFDAIISSYVFHLILDISVLDLAWKKLKKNGLLVGNFHKNRNVDIFKKYFLNKCQKLSFSSEGFSSENGIYVIVVK